MATSIASHPILTSPLAAFSSTSRLLHPQTIPPTNKHLSQTRSPSPASSICSRATSVDDLEDMSRISQIRPMYNSGASLEDHFAETSIYDDSNAMASSSRMVNGSRANGHVPNGVKPGEGQPKRFPEEEDEDILKESNNRFVLFPIRYRSVRQHFLI